MEDQEGCRDGGSRWGLFGNPKANYRTIQKKKTQKNGKDNPQDIATHLQKFAHASDVDKKESIPVAPALPQGAAVEGENDSCRGENKHGGGFFTHSCEL